MIESKYWRHLSHANVVLAVISTTIMGITNFQILWTVISIPTCVGVILSLICFLTETAPFSSEDTSPTDLRVMKATRADGGQRYFIQQLNLFGWWRTIRTHQTEEAAIETLEGYRQHYQAKRDGKIVQLQPLTDNKLLAKVAELEKLLEAQGKI